MCSAIFLWLDMVWVKDIYVLGDLTMTGTNKYMFWVQDIYIYILFWSFLFLKTPKKTKIFLVNLGSGQSVFFFCVSQTYMFCYILKHICIKNFKNFLIYPEIKVKFVFETPFLVLWKTGHTDVKKTSVCPVSLSTKNRRFHPPKLTPYNSLWECIALYTSPLGTDTTQHAPKWNSQV